VSRLPKEFRMAVDQEQRHERVASLCRNVEGGRGVGIG
jgi:hypothetical protein